MSEHVPQDVLDENLRRLIASSVRRASPEFEEKLLGAVLAEVHSQRRIRVRRLWQTGFAAAAAAAVIVLAMIVTWRQRPGAAQDDHKPLTGPVAAKAGRVTPRHGLVSAEADQSTWQLADPQPIRAGQWIETHWGSEAAILLADQSQIALRPRTRVQLPRTSGRKVILARGTVRIEATRQPPGKSITVETPGSAVTVLGTRLESLRAAQRREQETERLALVAKLKAEEAKLFDVMIEEGLPGFMAEYLRPVLDVQKRIKAEAAGFPDFESDAGLLSRAIYKARRRSMFRKTIL